MRRHLSSALSARSALDDVAREHASSLEFDVLMAEGRYKEAELNARRFYEKVRTLYGEEHIHALETAGKFSAMLARQDKYDERSLLAF
jgi:hypothetical protein